ncbi:hypothetical protein ABEB36_009786 [Hypothenemus hampei]|uniref:Uncharacterized protein n=1 Tax=Hypothenemus hampei TaxID=57062 RepID=A0ABD1EKG1_HYPHA
MFKLRNIQPLLRYINTRNRCINHSLVQRFASTTSKQEQIDSNDIPVKFSASKAKTYKAKYSRQGTEDERLWYEPPVLLVSLAIFLLYFCVFREENDIDRELDRSLYSRIDGLEEAQLRMSLKYNLENGLDTTDIVKRLQEIDREKQSQNE